MTEVKRFENDLRTDPTLRKKLDEAAARIKDEGKAKTDAELIVVAAGELGYHFTLTELERSQAEDETLDVEEMERMAGGKVNNMAEQTADGCLSFTSQYNMDQDLHNGKCLTVWHCLTAFLHTHVDDDYKEGISCWSDYSCAILNN